MSMNGSWRAPGWPGWVLAWLAGIALQLQQATLWSAWLYGLAALVAIVGLCCGRWWRLAGAGVMAWALAGLHACAMPGPIDAALEGRDLDVVGVVQGMAQRQESGWRLRFEIEQAQHRGRTVQVPRWVYLGAYSPSMKDGQAAQTQLPLLQPGERWRLRVRLKAAHGHINPNGFDYELWLWEQGIRATGYVRLGDGDPPPQRLVQTWRHPLEWARQRVRDRMLERLGPDGAGAVLAALVTGDQAAIDRSAWDIFRATGVAHLMSISGLHVTMLGWLVARLLAVLWRLATRWGALWALDWPAPRAAALGGLVAAVAYALFSGWGVPAQRTVCMLAVITLLRWQARQWPSGLVWACAGLVVLSLDPWALLQAGFWLSFVAVGVLLLEEQPQAGTQVVHGGLHQGGAWQAFAVRLRALWREQWRVSLALAPLGLLFFGQLSLSGLVANLLAIPWVSLLVTPLALLGVVFPPAWSIATALLTPLLAMLQTMAAWPWAALHVPMPPWPLAALATFGTFLLCLPWPWFLRGWGLVWLLPALLWQPSRPGPGVFEWIAADVGQGNAVLVRTARHSLLYDAGPRYSPESDAGHRVLVPLLMQLDERVDVLMLSHRDTDHTGGAPAVLAMQPQARLWSSLEPTHPLAQRPDHLPCRAGQRWVWDEVLFEVLHPESDAGSPRPNALSCVLRISAAGGSVLLAGDIEAAQERQLLARGLAPVDLLLVPHHGSKTSSTEAFLDALQPRMALVQAGYRNRFGHPAPSVAQRYLDRGIRWWTSPDCGAATWRSDQPAQLRCERPATPRYWRHLPQP
ncbi:MAG: DNA internalization-related competence protein ComEC/Rec2 [Limnohabitans sp.]